MEVEENVVLLLTLGGFFEIENWQADNKKTYMAASENLFE
jgi:hypothetical protein